MSTTKALATALSGGTASATAVAATSSGMPASASLPATQPVTVTATPTSSATAQGESLLLSCCCACIWSLQHSVDLLARPWLPDLQAWHRFLVVQAPPMLPQPQAPRLPPSPILTALLKARRGCCTRPLPGLAAGSSTHLAHPMLPMQVHHSPPPPGPPPQPATHPPPSPPPVASRSPPLAPLSPLAAPRPAVAAPAPTPRLLSTPTMLLVLVAVLHR